MTSSGDDITKFPTDDEDDVIEVKEDLERKVNEVNSYRVITSFETFSTATTNLAVDNYEIVSEPFHHETKNNSVVRNPSTIIILLGTIAGLSVTLFHTTVFLIALYRKNKTFNNIKQTKCASNDSLLNVTS